MTQPMFTYSLRPFSLRCIVLTVIALGTINHSDAQHEGLTSFGIGLKPIVPAEFIGTGEVLIEGSDFNSSFRQRPGYSFGMIVRHELNKMWAFETGIYYVRRRFQIDIHDPETGYRAEMPYTLINYEIPLQGLVYVRVRDRLYMNASGGFSFDAYPSNVETIRFEYEQKTIRRRWIQTAIKANYGFEWRSSESGFFYLGAGYHRPLDNIAQVRLRYSRDGYPFYKNFAMEGAYLTIDLKYFFHEEPNRPRRRLR
jgi:hypothetical protein